MSEMPGEKEVVQGVFLFCKFTSKYVKYFPYPLSIIRVSMGLTDRRKTAKNLADSRKN